MAMCNSFHGLLFLWIYLLCLCQYSCLVSGTTRDYFDARLRLVEYLTKDSEIVKGVRPALNISTSVNVRIRIHLHEITNVNEKDQLLQTTVWLRFDWNNPLLTWDPAEYGGIESINANHELFWVPDVVLYNEANLDEKPLYKRLATKLVINRGGDCWWNAPASLLSQCKIDVSRFPFDKQECDVTIGSWTYTKDKLNITYFERRADVSHYNENGEWEVESALLHNRLKYYGPKKLPYPDVTFTLKLKRRSLYYFVYIVAPAAVISVLASFSFILPSENGERISLLNGVLVANSVYMLLVSSVLPETSDAIPILGKYLLVNIITIVLCLCATCVSLKLHDLTCPMRPWLWKIVEFFQNVKKNFSKCICGNEERNEETPRAMNNLAEASTQSNTDYMNSLAKEKFAKQWKTASKVLDTSCLIIFFLPTLA